MSPAGAEDMRRKTIASFTFLIMISIAGALPAQGRDTSVQDVSVYDREKLNYMESVAWRLPDAAPGPAVADFVAPSSCEPIRDFTLSPGVELKSVDTIVRNGATPPWCRVTLKIRHEGAKSTSTVWIGLPLENWNGRFLGLGGGGFQGGFPKGLPAAIKTGFAAGVTDAGNPLGPNGEERVGAGSDGSFALDADGRLNWSAVRNFGYLGIHDMTVAGKSLTASFYGSPSRYSYFTGCSTGGRQGQSEAQRYPGDYDGILSGAPAIEWSRYVPAYLWAQVVMREIKRVPQCKFDAARHALIAACDGDDGVADQVIGNPAICQFDPHVLIGTETECGKIDGTDAEVIRRIWDGPRRREGSRMWHGLDKGATIDVEDLMNTSNQFITSWYGYFLTQTPQWNSSAVTRAEFELLFDQSVEQYGAVFDASNPNLSAFAARGSRTIIWHGTVDGSVRIRATTDYIDNVRKTLTPKATDRFLRFYIAPGVAHCSGGDGPQPTHLLESLMAWVELGKVPGGLIAEKRDGSNNITRTGLLCPYPQRAVYRGKGLQSDAENYRCEAPR